MFPHEQTGDTLEVQKSESSQSLRGGRPRSLEDERDKTDEYLERTITKVEEVRPRIKSARFGWPPIKLSKVSVRKWILKGAQLDVIGLSPSSVDEDCYVKNGNGQTNSRRLNGNKSIGFKTRSASKNN